jgi:hypothetical protein
MSKGITQKMADQMTTYRIIGKNSFGTFTHGPDVKSYAKAIKLLEEYRRTSPTNAYTLMKVDCTVLPV